MHEHDVVEDLMDMVLEYCRDHGVEEVKKIATQLGTLTTFKREPIQFYFDIFKKEYPCTQNAQLEVEELAARSQCSACGHEAEISDPAQILCPQCGSSEITVTQGKDFLISYIEV